MGWGGEGDVDGDTLWDPALSQRLLFETALSQRLKSLRSPAPVRECFSMRYHSASSMLCAVPALLASSLYHDLVADCACMFLKG